MRLRCLILGVIATAAVLPMSPSPLTCASCAQPLENPQRCRGCGVFQPPDPRRDHFATLALPREFALDEALLERRVVAFGRDLHPDLAGSDPVARTRAVLGSAQLNEAYSILRDPYRRAEYLLKLAGGKSASDEKSVPPGFLESMLDERDALDAALAEGKAAVATTRERFEQRLRAMAAEIGELFVGLDTADDRARRLETLRQRLNVMAYYRSLLRDLREAARDQEDR